MSVQRLAAAAASSWQAVQAAERAGSSQLLRQPVAAAAHRPAPSASKLFTRSSPAVQQSSRRSERPIASSESPPLYSKRSLPFAGTKKYGPFSHPLWLPRNERVPSGIAAARRRRRHQFCLWPNEARSPCTLSAPFCLCSPPVLSCASATFSLVPVHPCTALRPHCWPAGRIGASLPLPSQHAFHRTPPFCPCLWRQASHHSS